MLNLLRIRNFAIIDELELELGPGLNVVTGETGAGKSILVDALELVLGAKGRPELVRTGEKQAVVEALFELPKELETAGATLEEDAEVVVRRVLSTQGRSRAYLAGSLCSMKELQEFAAELCDISSQHEHHSLTDPRAHLEYLDAFGDLLDLRQEVSQAHKQLSAAIQKKRDLHNAQAHRGEREALLRFQLQEIEDIQPTPGELSTLEQEQGRLQHAETLAQTAAQAEEVLYERDDSITTQLGKLQSDVDGAAHLDPTLKASAAQLEEAKTLLEDVAQDLSRYSRTVVVDPERLQHVSNRIDALRSLIRKYAGRTAEASLEGVIAHHATAEAELEGLDNQEAEIAKADAVVEQARTHAAAAAKALSQARSKAAKQLGSAISLELESLAMGDARVQVKVSPLAGEDGEVAAAGARMTALGIDHVEFLIAPNPGEDARPLRKIASGGELSRSLLAIKRVLAGLRSSGLYVFDEVDAGVGGAVAEVIGRKLHDVARHHQVLCITHLPQIAAFADRHFRVEKEVNKGRTRSQVHVLSDAERLQEVSRMLGGIHVSAKTRAAAEELIASAKKDGPSVDAGGGSQTGPRRHRNGSANLSGNLR